MPVFRCLSMQLVELFPQSDSARIPVAGSILPCPPPDLCCTSGTGSLLTPLPLLLFNQKKYQSGEKEIRPLIVELSVNDA